MGCMCQHWKSELESSQVFFFSFLHVKRLPAWEVFLVSGFLSISDYHRALHTSGVMLGQLARPGEPGVPADLLGELFMHLLRA